MQKFHSRILAWKILWTGEPAGLRFMGLQRVWHYWACTHPSLITSPKFLSPNTNTRRRQWHPTPVLCLENPMDRGAWWAEVHGVNRSQTRLSDFTLFFHFHVSEKEMAPHSSVLAWRIPGMGEPDGLPSMESYRVGHDWSDAAAAAAAVSKIVQRKIAL